jgi:NAD(P)-dependent dehydrogenase (short-subunit alcohol dehydrogenase family)
MAGPFIMKEQLAGRRVLVTGAATGIGAAAVDVLAAEGATVVATYHRTPAPERLAGSAAWIQCDFRGQAGADRGADEAVAIMGGLDVLIHAAGSWGPGIPGELSEDNLDAMFSTNVKATVYANQAAFRHMAGPGGRIVNFGSSEGVSGVPFSASYAMAKGAVHSWTRSAAKAWGKHGITVNAVVPAVETPGADRFRAFLGPEAAAAMTRPTAQRLAVASSLGPLPLGDPVRDLGPVLVFLASAGSRFITGQLLSVSGGLLMLGA